MSHSYRPLLISVCDTYGITLQALLSHRKQRDLVRARVQCAIMLRALGLSYPQIGKIMDRDHTSIMHMLGKTKKSQAVKHRMEAQNG